jgi:hypothetical protein
MAQQVWHERIVANLECCLFQKGTELQKGQGSMKRRWLPDMPAPVKIEW